MDIIYSRTTPSDNLTIDKAVESLSDDALTILAFIANETMSNFFNIEQGVSVELGYDSSKPFDVKQGEELIEAGLVKLTPSSTYTNWQVYINVDIIELLCHEYPNDIGYEADEIEDFLERIDK